MAKLNSCPIQNYATVVPAYFKTWLSMTSRSRTKVFTENPGIRKTLMSDITKSVADHFRSVEALRQSIIRLGFPNSAASFRNSLPVNTRTQSGDLGEILCTEYIIQNTTFKVPLKKLRWKDDRNLAMRGNDVLAFRMFRNVPQVLKAESKSRASLSNSVIEEAVKGVTQHDGRPNPSSLSFLQARLSELERFEEADFIAKLQVENLNIQNFRHLIFTLSGNDPLPYLKTHDAIDPNLPIERTLVGIQIADHQTFIAEIYEGCFNANF